MLKKTITYEDFNGENCTEDFYFHLTKAEVTKMELSASANERLSEKLGRIVEKAEAGISFALKDQREVYEIIEDLVRRSYGEKSDDGKRFVKSDEISNNFANTEAYSELMMELVSGGYDKAAAFINGIMPKVDLEESTADDKKAELRERYDRAKQALSEKAESNE